MHRFTLKELREENNPEYKNDLEILRLLVNDRANRVTFGSPLYERLTSIGRKLTAKIERAATTI